MPKVKRPQEPVELNPTAASLLGFLAMLGAPNSGYDLAAAIESSIGNFWGITRSQVYRELVALESSGFVTQGKAGPRERKPYALTAAGKRAFHEWIEREPGDDTIRSPMLLTVFFGDRVEPEKLARYLRGHRVRHERRLADLRARIESTEREHPFPAYTMRFGIMREETILAWFDTLAEDGLL